MKDKYPHLGKYYEAYQASRLANTRISLIETLKGIFEKKFRNWFCIWRTDDGQTVMCLGRECFPGSEIPVAPLVMELAPNSKFYLRLLKIQKNCLLHFPVMVCGTMMQVDLRKRFLIGVERLEEFVCKPSGELPPEKTLRFTRSLCYRFFAHI